MTFPFSKKPNLLKIFSSSNFFQILSIGSFNLHSVVFILLGGSFPASLFDAQVYGRNFSVEVSWVSVWKKLSTFFVGFFEPRLLGFY
jgi:hypothetical protein